MAYAAAVASLRLIIYPGDRDLPCHRDLRAPHHLPGETIIYPAAVAFVRPIIDAGGDRGLHRGLHRGRNGEPWPTLPLWPEPWSSLWPSRGTMAYAAAVA
jgi:hypothetical protein